jgi:hypothetical protein
MRFRRLLKHQLQRLKSIRTTGRSPGASFLSLPTELRFQIYDIVKDFDLSHYIDIGADKPWRYPVLRLPLRDLARTCKLVAEEVRYHHRLSIQNKERYTKVILYNKRTISRPPRRRREGHDTRRVVYDVAFTRGVSEPPESSTVYVVFKGRVIMDVQIIFRAKKDARDFLDDPLFGEKVERYTCVLECGIEKAPIDVRKLGLWGVIRLIECCYETSEGFDRWCVREKAALLGLELTS